MNRLKEIIWRYLAAKEIYDDQKKYQTQTVQKVQILSATVFVVME